MKSVEHKENNMPITRSRLLVNLGWWLILTIAGLIYLYSPIGRKFWHQVPAFLIYVEVFGPILFIQTIPHWFILHHLYPGQKHRNIISVLYMPIFLFFSYGFFSLLLSFIGLSQLK